MIGMREFEWQLLIKSFSMAIGSRRIILRSPTMNTWSVCSPTQGFYGQEAKFGNCLSIKEEELING